MNARLATAFVFLLTGMDLLACSCRDEQTIPEALRSADAVFVGLVVAEWEVEVRSLTDMPYFPLMVRKYAVVPQLTFKGGRRLDVDTLFVYTAINNAGCGSHFTVGGRYVIYGDDQTYLATGREARDFPSGIGIYWTNSCTRTRAFEETEVKELEALK